MPWTFSQYANLACSIVTNARVDFPRLTLMHKWLGGRSIVNEVISVKGKHIVKDSCFHQWRTIPDLTNNQCLTWPETGVSPQVYYEEHARIGDSVRIWRLFNTEGLVQSSAVIIQIACQTSLYLADKAVFSYFCIIMRDCFIPSLYWYRTGPWRTAHPTDADSVTPVQTSNRYTRKLSK